jgi:tungstate transport system ATP-binding protein
MLYRIRNLQYSYGGQTPAVDIGSGEFEEGKIHVFLGPNGSGKTTLLKLFNRLLLPASGEIEFDGTPIRKSSEVRDKTVYVHQNPLLLSGTVFDNVAYGLRVRGMKRRDAEKKVRETLRITALEGFERRRSTALSGGEKQRVAIARALVLEPRGLLLDEPTASVDRENVGRIEEILRRINRELGCTVMVSTHDLPFAYRICDRLIHMDEGAIAPAYENIVTGETFHDDPHFLIFRSEGIDIFCPRIDGNFTKAVIDYEQIILSAHPISTSARNNLHGRICEVNPSPAGREQVDVEICVDGSNERGGCGERSGGELRLVSRVTEQSAEELRLTGGGGVYLAFKASSVRLY